MYQLCTSNYLVYSNPFPTSQYILMFVGMASPWSSTFFPPRARPQGPRLGKQKCSWQYSTSQRQCHDYVPEPQQSAVATFFFHHLPEITTSGVLTAVNEGANVMFEPSEREHVYNHSTYLIYIHYNCITTYNITVLDACIRTYNFRTRVI